MVYLADISDFKDEFFENAALLLPAEKREPILAIKNERAKRESVLAWTLLRFALAQNGVSSLPELNFSEKGKPYFKKNGVFFNLSHSKTKVCTALSFEGDIGVDVQVESNFSDEMRKRVFCKNEFAAEGFENSNRIFTRLWAIKESFLKNSGVGIAFDLKSLDFSNGIQEDFFEKDCLFYSLFSFEAYELSVCSKEKERQRLTIVFESELVEFVNNNGFCREGEK